MIKEKIVDITEFQKEIDHTDRNYDILQRISGIVLGALEEPLNSEMVFFRLTSSFREGYIHYTIYFCKLSTYLCHADIMKLFCLFNCFQLLEKKNTDFCKHVEAIETNMSITTSHTPKHNEHNAMCIELEVFIKEKKIRKQKRKVANPKKKKTQFKKKV